MRTFGIIAGLAAASIWGGMYVVSKVVLEVIPPFTLLNIRLLLGIISLGSIILLKKGFRATRKQVGVILLVGIIGFGISLGFQFTGTKLSSAANAALVTSASPVFILLFGALILHERVTSVRLFALLLASVGVLIVVDPRAALYGGKAAIGNVLLLAAALTWGLYSVLIKKSSKDLNIIEVSTFAFIGGWFFSLPIMFSEIKSENIGTLTLPIILGVLYLGIIATALAMYLWNKSLDILEAGLVSLLFFAQPVVGVALGTLILDEVLNTGFWVGAGMIGLGLLIAARSDIARNSDNVRNNGAVIQEG
ncbi:MAG: DMT family transporter [Anaerolineales bacterium]